MDETSGPAWLKAALDQRISLLKDMVPYGIVELMDMTVVMTTLTEPKPDATDEEREAWENTCDNCGVFQPDGCYTGQGAYAVGDTGRQVIIIFGCCKSCKEAP